MEIERARVDLREVHVLLDRRRQAIHREEREAEDRVLPEARGDDARERAESAPGARELLDAAGRIRTRVDDADRAGDDDVGGDALLLEVAERADVVRPERRPAAEDEDAAGRRIFVLGGGAALGAHHVGALRYLEEQGITPDVVVASSIGVINACAYATGGVEQLARAWRGFRSLPRIISPSLWQNPILGLSLFSMDRLTAAVEQYMDFPKIHASPLDLHVVVLNLSRGRGRSEEHTSELQSPMYLVCRLLLEKKKE